MANQFAELTAFIPQLKGDNFGEWVIDKKNDGTPEHPMQMPYVDYPDAVDDFVDTLCRYCRQHPELEHIRYDETLRSHGIEWSMKSMEEADVSTMDAKGVIALLIGVICAERFSDGVLQRFLKSGCILRWLERLAEIDEQ